MSSSKNLPPVRCAILGLGTVGASVAQLLSPRPDIELTHGVVRDLNKTRDLGRFTPQLSTDPFAALTADDVDVVIELLGGIEPSVSVIKQALSAGKHVITANKDVMATYGDELRQLAQDKGVYLKYEAAVCAGIPLINPLQQSLGANRIDGLMGILNGTCNYILCRMSDDCWDYATALQRAQDLGFAESDPTNDVSGLDAAYKLTILAKEAFGTTVDVHAISREGIDGLNITDISLAKQMGYAVKLLGIANRTENQQLDIRIHPTLVPLTHPLASIHDEYNALWLKGDAVDELMFYGKGAGGHPTASGVCGDLLSIVPLIQSGATPSAQPHAGCESALTVIDPDASQSKWYLRFNTADQPGVVGCIGTAFGNAHVSIESIMQQGINPDGTASIVVITQPQAQGAVKKALNAIAQLSNPPQLACRLRMLP